ncbi:hypothetical protein HDU86_007494 [Geranomyces michiganensis]|nr:hypothetical protein HDU86_007494 [Geranomyces michiganensis]
MHSLTDLSAQPALEAFSASDKQQVVALLHKLVPNPNDFNESALLTTLANFQSAPAHICYAALSVLLSRLAASWNVFRLVQTHIRLWKALPEASKAGHDTSLRPLINRVEAQIHNTYTSLLDLFPTTTAPAIRDSNGTLLDHQKLTKFLASFRIPGVSPTSSTTKSSSSPSSSSCQPIIAIALPNGPTLAVAVLAVATYATATPINASSGSEQFRVDVLQGGASVILVLAADVDRLDLRGTWVRDNKISIVLVEPRNDLTFTMRPLSSDKEIAPPPTARWSPNSPDAIAIILFTSGTSGKKKLVPLTVKSIVAGVAFVMESWGLTRTDICLNQMPLNHVGGILRNLFSPIMAGGSTVCCTAFDPNLFWDIVEDQQPTWYYASPTMHNMILDASQSRKEALARSRMRLVCNAAGGLLPSLAVQLRDTFKCTVLPSYGMTECMPISTPPLNYTLDRPGTSGVSVGPEISILDGNYAPETLGSIGRICVRGSPTFPGYLKDGRIDKSSAFTPNGWFDTGDMGYMDAAGFLYITGRSKEVINRGGELISPFEIEEAIVTAAKKPGSAIFGKVSQALAFSVPHDVLQEVVGLVLVTPEGSTRADLRQVQDAVSSSLQQVKWPVVVVYMDDVPKNNNKVLRIKLAERLDMAEIDDSVIAAKRHFVASCPPPNTPLSVKIRSAPCAIDFDWAARTFVELVADNKVAVHVRPDKHDGYPEVFLAPFNSHSPPDKSVLSPRLAARTRDQLDGLYVPSRIHVLDNDFPRNAAGFVDDLALTALLAPPAAAGALEGNGAYDNDIERRVCHIAAGVLGCPPATLSGDADFFFAGGDSLKAGRLLSALRKEFALRLPIDVLFTNPRLGSLAALIAEKIASAGGGGARGAAGASSATLLKPDIPLPGCQKTYSSTNPFLMLFQLLPIALLYPMKRALTWTILVVVLSRTDEWTSTTSNVFGRLFNLILAMAIGRAATEIVAPLVAIALKWIVIGRYRAGIYPMWGWYHTRWWFVQKAIQVAGFGMFSGFNISRVIYYRLLGARIGRNVTIETGATLGEYDLVEIGDNSTLDRCVCRPFGAERNTSMYLGPIVIGRNCSIGLTSVVAPGSFIPDNTCIGPNSSSWEQSDADESFRLLSATQAPSAHWLLTLFLTWPWYLLSRLFSAIPWILGLWQLVVQTPRRELDALVSILNWFAQPHRIAYHYVALVANTSVGPVFLFVFVVAIRWFLDVCFGRVRPSPANKRGTMDTWRMAFMRKLMNAARFRGFTELFGGHYEMTSIAVRAMGGKVGKRVYWPGTGPSITDYNLIEIGNDVVFGSRSHLVTSDGIGSDYIRVGDGAMVSDRVVILPGTTLGEAAVFGSGALGRRNKTYLPNSTWVGSVGGEAVNLTQGSKGTGDSSSSTDDSGSTIDPNDSRQSMSSSAGPPPGNVVVGNGGPASPTSGGYDFRPDYRLSRRTSLSTKRKSVREMYTLDSNARSMKRLSMRRESRVSRGSVAWGESTLTLIAQRASRTMPDLFREFSNDKVPTMPANPRRSTISYKPDIHEMHRRSVVTAKFDDSALHLHNGPLVAGGKDLPPSAAGGPKPEPPYPLSRRRSSRVAAVGGTTTSSTPFGRAFYEGKAAYFVLGRFPIFLYSAFTFIFCAFYWNIPTVSGVQVVARIVGGKHTHVLDPENPARVVILYFIFTGIISILMTLQALLASLIVIGAKWALMGRRRPGNYNWDLSSYCQRWQMFLTIETLRRHCYGGHGIMGLLTGTHYCTLYFRAMGATIGKDCALFAGGLPSLMFTEPDLLTLGDRVAVDDASLVSHINSRGHFNLNPLTVGTRSVLRTGSRLLSGAHMGDDTCLLEHTLVMAGDFVDHGVTMQGWPAQEFEQSRVPSLPAMHGGAA